MLKVHLLAGDTGERNTWTEIVYDELGRKGRRDGP